MKTKTYPVGVDLGRVRQSPRVTAVGATPARASSRMSGCNNIQNKALGAEWFGDGRRHSRADVRFPQGQDRHFAVCDQLIVGCVFRSRWSGGAVHQCVTAARSCKQEFTLDPLSLPIRPRINPVKSFGALATCGDADIVQLRERGPASSLPGIQGAGIEPSQTVH